MDAYDCALGGCAAANAQKRQVLQAEQQRGADLRTEHTRVQQKQKSVRNELSSVQKEYDSLSADISNLQASLRKEGKENSEVATELTNLQRDINLRRNMSGSSTDALQKQELVDLRKREASLKEQVKILLAN